MANLNPQPFGLRGADLVYANADAGGDVAINRPGLFVAVRNVHGSLSRDVQIEATRACTPRGVLHDLAPEAIPPTPAGAPPWLIPVGWNADRFALVAVEYPTGGHAADLRIAFAYIDGHTGRGEAAAPAALGASPGTVTVVDQAAALVWSPAAADGMRATNGDGETALYVVNDDVADKTATVIARGRCSHGFLDHYSLTIPAGSQRELPRFDTAIFGTRLEVVFDDVTLVQVAGARHARA